MQSYGSLHLGKVGNGHSITAGYIQLNFQSNKDRIGAFQSGVIGYFNNNVINLDGKLDHNALKALLRNKDKNDVFVFNEWMFSSSPSIAPFDHPVYDIWLVDCY